jgi:hypothetical protein
MNRKNRRLLLAVALAMASFATTFPSPMRASAEDAPAVQACKANGDCAADEFCAQLFGSCGGKGRCETRPKAEDCAERGHIHIKPVCGCDGKSYDNACLAAVEAVNVKSEGKCGG